MLDALPSFAPPRLLRNAHLQTVVPHLFRRVDDVRYHRCRLDTPDGDFLDLDWSHTTVFDGGPRRAVVLSHGLEGSSQRPYIRGMVRAFNRRGWDAVAWNYRGCSGTPNHLFKSYHSGVTDDLDLVVQHALSRGYEALVLVGFSLGGNLTLKYLGEQGATADARIAGGVTVSVPIDLASSAKKMARPENLVYMRRFLRSLEAKMQIKRERFPGLLDPSVDVSRMRSFEAFDDYYTAPAHGFASAQDYWAKCSARSFLPGIRRPTLLVNAEDDPFLSAACYPHDVARSNPQFHLLVTGRGGHVGFVPGDRRDEYWSEAVAAHFAERALRIAQG